MAFLAAIPAWVSTAAAVGGTVLSAYSQNQASKAEARLQQESAEYNAEQIRKKGVADYAQATQVAAEEARRGRIIASNATAQMAASGGSARDAGATDRLSDINAITEQNVLSAMYEGETALSGSKERSGRVLYEGDSAASAVRSSGLGGVVKTVMSGTTKLFADAEKFSRNTQNNKSLWRNPNNGQLVRIKRW